MSLLLVATGTIFIIELFYFLRRRFHRCRTEIVTTAIDSVRTIRSKNTPDSSKAKQLQRYSLKLFSQSLMLCVLMLLTISPLVVIVIVNYLSGGDVLQLLMTLDGIFLSILSATIYIVARFRFFNG